MAGAASEWLLTTVSAVREIMIKRLEDASLDEKSHREVELALEEIDVMWEELQAQATQLERENARYAEFFEFAPDPYVITDAGGGVREANAAAGELFGVARADMVGRPLCDFVAEEDRLAFLTRSTRLTTDPAAARGGWRARVRPPGGVALACDFSVRAIPLKRSGVSGLCWLVRPA
jgi:PAS domain S-box-containing protein